MILIVLTFIINLLAPIVNPLGAIGICLCIIEDDFHILTLSAILAVVGLIYGIEKMAKLDKSKIIEYNI